MSVESLTQDENSRDSNDSTETRKSKRSNRGQRYKALMKQGVLQGSREKPRKNSNWYVLFLNCFMYIRYDISRDYQLYNFLSCKHADIYVFQWLLQENFETCRHMCSFECIKFHTLFLTLESRKLCDMSNYLVLCLCIK